MPTYKRVKIGQDVRRTIRETLAHIKRVRHFMRIFINDLVIRAEDHDVTKLDTMEIEGFHKMTMTTPMANLTYGTPEYDAALEKIKPLFKHHYKNNDHHPQHFKNGVDDMDLGQLVEMICDWKAASERNQDGSIEKSLEINKVRFGMSEQLVKIFQNTIKNYFYETRGQHFREKRQKVQDAPENERNSPEVPVDSCVAPSDPSEAFARCADSASQAGVSSQEVINLFEIAQRKSSKGGAVIGNALNSIFSRISRNDVIEQVRNKGVPIDMGQKGMDRLRTVLDWLSTNPECSNEVKELIGGVYQVNITSAILKASYGDSAGYQLACELIQNAPNEA